MYVRDAKNREEVWLLDHIEQMGLDDRAFRSRDYVIAIDEHSGAKAGFGRIRIHQAEDDEYCELTSIGVIDEWRGNGVGAHIVERLIEYAADAGFETVYSLAPTPGYLTQFGFDPIDHQDLPQPLNERLEAKQSQHDDPIVPLSISVESFSMPPILRERFKRVGKPETQPPEDDADSDELAQEFGIDPDKATYKYDTSGRRS